MPFPRPDGRISDGSDKIHLESVHPDVTLPISISPSSPLPVTVNPNPLPVSGSITADIPTGVTSTANSTTTPLLASATFTGAWEDISDYATITINGAADVAGTLYADFSTDQTTSLDNYRQVQLSDGLSGIWGIHGLVKVARYFRIRIVNGSTSQASISVETIFHPTPLIAVPTSRTAQIINDYSSVVNTRLLTDPRLEEASGKHSDRQVIQKFGSNPSVGSGVLEDIWFGGGLYTGFLQSAAAIRVRSGGNANDTAAGSGCRSVTIVGLDQNWNDASETIATNGTSASSATTTTFIRVFRVFSQDVGTYGASSIGDVIIETTSGIIVASVEADRGQSQLAIYTIPNGKMGFVRRLGATVEGSKPTDVFFVQRQNADDISAPMTGKRLFWRFSKLEGQASVSLESYIGPFPARTDIWAQAIGPSGGSGVSATFDLVLMTE